VSKSGAQPMQPAAERAPFTVVWETRLSDIADWRSNIYYLLWLGVLSGFLSGGGMSLYQLSDFSPVPPLIGFVFALMAGMLIGLLTHHLQHSLVAFLWSGLVTVIVCALALVLPEFEANRLGLELATELSIAKALLSTLFALPMVLIGILISKVLPNPES